ncbi:MAG: hypothetical protein IPF59_01080 [Ignavibacteria bacterium]|nr:hypothetical protein [Ignavibacteria bacterium]MBP7093030.1 hypothetical protein [Candidatus Kapabacteria bacterium]
MKRVQLFEGACRLLTACAIAICMTIADQPQAKAQAWVAEAQQNGFTLKKVESDTAINIGQTFSYTVYFSIPAGATNVTITDVLPGSLEFLGASYTSPCGTPTVVSPAINAMGGTYSLSWASLPSGCSGSFTITCQFPNGTTCNGTTARNRVCLQGFLGAGSATDLCTPFVSIRAIATEPWNITKYITGAAYQGGPCPYATADSVVTYQVCVYKNVGTTGQLNLVGGVVTDVLPTGAILQSSTCSATQSGNTITWNVGSLSATTMYNMVCCQFVVLYPRALFPNGSTITNKAVLTGTTGTANQPCGQISDTSNTTCVEIKAINSATISKWAYTNGQPGCTGKYLVYICNNGTTTISSFTVTDTIPTTLSGVSLGTVSAGLTANLTSGIVTATGTNLAPGQCRYFEINFTIPLTAVVGSTITNCAWFTAPGFAPIKACASFVVAAPAPAACVWKEVCSELPSYTPGQIFRYRLRVQNIGGLALTGATITDVLDNNLQYIGNASYYSSTAWNAPCSPATTWAGVTITNNPVTNTVTATLPSIPAVCQNMFFSNCGMYGTAGVPFYYIEFDVKVVDTSALGNIPNKFTISGGNLPSTVTSNIEYVTVVGTAGFTLSKGVKQQGGPTYSSTTTSTAGGVISYKLGLTVATGSVSLRHVTFADLLPRDNGATDQLILGPCTPRGSAFNVAWNSAITSAPPATAYANPLSFARVTNFAPTGAPGPMFTAGCGTLGTWTPGLSAGAKNPGYYFGAAPIAATFSATSEFNANVGPGAADKATSCNTFAANAAVRHLIASTIISDQVIGMLESNPACVTIEKLDCIDSVKLGVVCAGKDAAGNQQYTFTISGWNANAGGVLMLSSPQGTFSPASFTIPTGSFTITSTFTDIPPVDAMITLHWALVINGQVICRDSVLRDLPPCPTEPPSDCCKEFIRRVDHTKLTYNNAGNVSLTATMTAGPAPIKQFSATIVSVQRRTVCNNVPSAWQRCFGDILSGAITPTLAPGPLLLQLYSREAQWGPGECISFMQGAGVQLNMLFPAPPASFKCFDTLIFAIRYSFTDCKCVTCTDLVYDTIVRKYAFVPWDHSGWTGGPKWTGVKHGVKGAEEAQADTATTMSVVMQDDTKGTLWIVNPARPDNTTTMQGAEVICIGAPLVSLKSGATDGIMTGSTGFIAVDAPPGTTLGVDLVVDNSAKLKQFPVDVRYLYTDASGSGQEFSETVRYIARVPGAAPDVVAGDPTTKPKNVRTYAITFTNANGYNARVAAVRLRASDSVRILAVGPASEDASSALLALIANDNDGHSVSAALNGLAGIEPGTSVQPIYLMLSGIEGATVDLGFASYDMAGGLISEGTFTLSDPISKVNGGGNDRPSLQINSVVPNPAGSQVTVALTLDQPTTDAELIVTDIRGTTLLTLLHRPLDEGNHVVQADVHSLPQGSYTIVLRTPHGVYSQPLRIVR